jgi:diguanylate cyclase
MSTATNFGPLSKHTLRLRRTLFVVNSALVLTSLFWCFYFAMRAQWLIVALDLAMIAAGTRALILTRRGSTRAALFLLSAGLFIGVTLICITLDIPTAQSPRAAHHYLLVLGMGTFLMLKEEPSWLRHGIPLTCFIAFFAFASTQWGIVSPLTLSDEIRIPGTWITNAVSLIVLYSLLHVMQSDISEHNAMVADLRKGLLDNQFELYYQPQSGDDGRIAGAEALIRWKHPQNGLISPGEFIPIAEQTGFILPLGHWVLGAACAQLVTWSQNSLTASLVLAVNVSAQQFRQADYVAQVLSVIERSGANPIYLKLELTESMLVNDVDDIISKMTSLQHHGVQLSLDDFGTGYSSLNYLKKLPLNQLKIDQSFVRDVLNNRHDAAIARTVVSLAQNMGLHVIAEGVETEGQRQFLSQIGCPAYQGYLLSRPLPIAAFDTFIYQYEQKQNEGFASY